MKRLFLFAALLSPLCGASVFIDCGAATDQYFTGGIAYTVQPAADTTLRFSSNSTTPFSYKIPVADGSYVVTLNFLEPSNVPPARAFSVTINDQLVYPRLTMPGYLVPFSRSATIASVGGFINIRFDTIVRSAVVSSIQISPVVATQNAEPKREYVTEAVPVWMGDGYYVPRPFSEPDTTVQLTYENMAVYRNGLRQRGNTQIAGTRDYLPQSSSGQLKFVPVSGLPWLATDTLVVDYTAIWPLPAIPTGGSDVATVASVSPSTTVAGGPLFSITLTGLGFLPDAFVSWNGSLLPTTFIDSSHLQAEVSLSYIANPGTFSVGVGLSVINFVVTPQSPTSPSFGLVGYWKFDGTALDSSGNHDDGTVRNPAWVAARGGTALKFDGTTEVLIPDFQPINPVSALSVSVWINATDWNGNRRIVQKADDGQQYRLLAEGGQLVFDAPCVGCKAVGPLPSAQVWHLITGTVDASGTRLYVDGQLIGAAPGGAALVSTATSLNVGMKSPQGSPGDHFSGLLNELRIYNRVLTQPEIIAAFTS